MSCRESYTEHGVLIEADVIEGLKSLPDNSISMAVTSPPYYGLRNYGMEGQIGQEETPEEYISKLTTVFREVHRVLVPSGTLWLNIADSYAGSRQGAGVQSPSPFQRTNRGTNYMTTMEHKSRLLHVPGCKSKDLIGIPWMLAFAIKAEGFYLRQDIIWFKTNTLPESVKDRCTKAHEYLFLFSKSRKYYFDNKAIEEDAKHVKDIALDGIPLTGKRNRRSVWPIPTKPYPGAHAAVFPPNLARLCILAGSPKEGIVLDPFMGSGTVAEVCIEEERDYIGIDLNPSYIELAKERISKAIAKKGEDHE